MNIDELIKIKEKLDLEKDITLRYLGATLGTKVFMSEFMQDDEWGIIAGKSAYDKIKSYIRSNNVPSS